MADSFTLRGTLASDPEILNGSLTVLFEAASGCYTISAHQRSESGGELRRLQEGDAAQIEVVWEDDRLMAVEVEPTYVRGFVRAS